jgi:rRNA maturation RNase YbeY
MRFPTATLTVLFAGDARMRSLNARYRGIDATTDVLSFPAKGGDEFVRLPGRPHLGDVAISVPVARRQALERGHGVAREIEILLLHGYLHLLGYDHERDTGRMERTEQRLRRALGLMPRRGSA